MAAAKVGLATLHCRYHVQFRARHGSLWYPSYRASDLKPYLDAATAWIKEHRSETFIRHTMIGLRGLLHGSGHVERAQNMKRRPASSRAKVAFARLREANVKPERILAVFMGMAALIEDDAGSHRVREFLIVQAAKAVHRLASGTHRRWDFPMDDGSTRPVEMHQYPRSAGRVLRLMGEALDEACGDVVRRDLEAIRALKMQRFGPHPSSLPDWRPLWARQLALAVSP